MKGRDIVSRVSRKTISYRLFKENGSIMQSELLEEHFLLLLKENSCLEVSRFGLAVRPDLKKLLTCYNFMLYPIDTNFISWI